MICHAVLKLSAVSVINTGTSRDILLHSINCSSFLYSRIAEKKNQRRISKLALALKSNDRKLLTGHSAKAHHSTYQQLENLIIDQIFEAEALEKRVERRKTLLLL